MFAILHLEFTIHVHYFPYVLVLIISISDNLNMGEIILTENAH